MEVERGIEIFTHELESLSTRFLWFQTQRGKAVHFERYSTSNANKVGENYGYESQRSKVRADGMM